MARKFYGSHFGNLMKSVRGEIAAATAGSGGDLAGAETALAEELAQACGLALDEYAKVESGEVDPTEEQCAAIARVLASHGKPDYTAERLMEIAAGGEAPAEEKPGETPAPEGEPDSEEEEPAGDPKPEDEEEEDEETKALRAQASDAVTLRSSLASAESNLTTLRAELAAKSERIAALEKREPLAVLGEAALAEKRATFIRRMELRAQLGGPQVTDAARAKVEQSSPEELETLASFAGLDPIADPLCAKCKSEFATTYRSSEPAVNPAKPGEPGASPKGSELPVRKATTSDVADAALAYQRQMHAEGKTVPVRSGETEYEAACRVVGRFEHAEILALAGKA